MHVGSPSTTISTASHDAFHHARVERDRAPPQLRVHMRRHDRSRRQPRQLPSRANRSAPEGYASSLGWNTAASSGAEQLLAQ